MKREERHVELPALTRSATVQPETVNEAKRTVQVTWTTGARVMRGFFDRYWEELSLDPKHVRLDRLNNGAPFLNAHDGGDANGVVGVVESASLAKGEGTATVRFARAEDDPNADAIFRKVKDGILRNVSVGYRVHTMEKISDGADKIPVFRATDWEPYELSVVPMGADAGAGFRSADSQQVNKCVLVTREEQRKMGTTEEDLKQKTGEESPAVVATRAASAALIEEAKVNDEEKQRAVKAAVDAERNRVTEIRKLGTSSGFGEQWSDEMIRQGVPLQLCRDMVLEEMAKEPGNHWGRVARRPPITGGEDEHTKRLRGLEAWMIEHTGVREQVEAAHKAFPRKFKGEPTVDPGEFRGLTPVDVARLCIERGPDRISTRGMDRRKIVGLAFTQRGANYQTQGDFPTLLENVLGKVLLGAYATQENTWSRFCMSTDVKDFRSESRYRTGSLPGLDVIPEHAEYQTGVIPDGSKYTIATQRMGKMFGLSQETIINDDMGALTQMAAGLGAAAMRSVETAVYALLTANSGLGPTQTDTHPFFYSTRGNVNGTGSVLGEAGLDADRVIMRQQLDPNTVDYLDLQPAVLLVPDSLYASARKINNSAISIGTLNDANSVQGLFKDVVGTPRLTGTRRYLFGTTMDAIVVAFLSDFGRGPVIDSMNGWRIDGVEWKVSLYAKAQMGDPKGAVTNAGS